MWLGESEIRFNFNDLDDAELQQYISDLHRQMGVIGVKLTLAEKERSERRERKHHGA